MPVHAHDHSYASQESLEMTNPESLLEENQTASTSSDQEDELEENIFNSDHDVHTLPSEFHLMEFQVTLSLFLKILFKIPPKP
jgi:hypothetical protein